MQHQGLCLWQPLRLKIKPKAHMSVSMVKRFGLLRTELILLFFVHTCI